MSESIEEWRRRQASYIIEAKWYSAQQSRDVTELVRQVVREGHMQTANVGWLPDPRPGWKKVLEIRMNDQGLLRTFSIKEEAALPSELFNPFPQQIADVGPILDDQLDFVSYARDAGDYLKGDGIHIDYWPEARSELTILLTRLKQRNGYPSYHAKQHAFISVEDIKNALTTKEAHDRMSEICHSVNPIVSAAPILNWMKRVDELDALNNYNAATSKKPQSDGKPVRSMVSGKQNSKIREWLGGQSANVAIVFTDLVESTLTELRLGSEAYRKLQHSHFKRARESIAKHNGIEIKTIGDSFLALFKTSIESLDFAIELKKYPGASELKVRAGIHVGMVFEQDSDVSGFDVNLASRTVSAAKLDQIFLTEEAKRNIDREKPQRFNNIAWTRHVCDIKEGKIVLWEALDGEVHRVTREGDQSARAIDGRQRKPAIAIQFVGFLKQISFEWEMETRSGHIDPNRIQAILERVRKTLVEYAKDLDETKHAVARNQLLEAAAQTANALRLNPFKELTMVEPDQWMDQAATAIQLLASLLVVVQKTRWE